MAPKRRTIKQTPGPATPQTEVPPTSEPVYQPTINRAVRSSYNEQPIHVEVENDMQQDIEVPVPKLPDVVYRNGQPLEVQVAPVIEVAKEAFYY